MRKNLTSVLLEGIKPPANGQAAYWDKKVTGLGFRVSRGGRRTWVLAYRYEGRMRWLTLGTYPILSLADARDLAKVKLHVVQTGGDPVAEKHKTRDADTFAVLAERYLNEHARRFKKASSTREDERNIRNELLPLWGNQKAASITRKDVIALVDGIAARGAEIHANRILALISKVFNFGIDKEVVDTNPAHKVKKPSPERQRDRVLAPAEIRKVWQAFDDEETPHASALFKILMLTGQRRGEVRAMRWSELDLDGGWWTIPKERVKNKKEHRVPLVGQALELLRLLRSDSNGISEAVFTGRDGVRPLSSPQKPLVRAVQRSGISFRVHDLRRTVGTQLGAMGIDRTTIKKLLNHSEKGDVTAIYDRHRYDDEKRSALMRWDARLKTILTGETAAKVVELRPAAGT